MPDKIRYLAYGSNLHPLRLAARVPSARVLGVVELPGHILGFHKRSHDDSGKCLLYPSQDAHALAWGVLYEFDADEKPLLDHAEGRGNGYLDRYIELRFNGTMQTALVYEAQASHIDTALLPYHWYKRLVIAGARHHGFPPDYIAAIEAVASKDDKHHERARENAALLHRMGWV
jgi:hypothetical protein